MPPKKGKKKKGKKSGKSTAKKSAESKKESEPKLSHEGKTNFLIQSKDLEKQIENLQRKCDDLEILNSMFDEEFVQMNVDKEDITEYLRETLAIRNEEIAVVRIQLEELQNNRTQENELYKELITTKKSDFENIKEELSSEKRMKNGQLASMEEFKVQQEELKQKFEDIEEQIQELNDLNTDDVYQREKEAVIEMERLKKEMVEKVNNVATEFRKVSNRQMAETNKKTIRENVELSSKIKGKSEETLKLLEENEKLRNIIEREQKYDLEISHTVEMDLQRKYNNNIKEIKKWVVDCREVEEELENFESDEYRSKAEQIQAEHKLLNSQNQCQKEELELINAENIQLEQEIKMNENAIIEEKKTLKVYKRLINRTKKAMIDVENLMDPSEEFTEAEVQLRRQKMLISLLELLNSAKQLGFGMSPVELCQRPNSSTSNSRLSKSII